MKNIRQRIKWLMALIILFAGHPTKAEESQLRIRTIAMTKFENPTWHIETNEKSYTKLDWPLDQPSHATISRNTKELTLHKANSDENGELKFIATQTLVVPEGTVDCIIVAWRDEIDHEMQFMLINDNLKQAKFNDWILINTCKQEVSISYGANTSMISLSAGENKNYKIQALAGTGNPVTAQTNVKGTLKTIYSTYWAAQQNQRSLVFFYVNDGRVNLRRVLDPLSRDK